MYLCGTVQPLLNPPFPSSSSLSSTTNKIKMRYGFFAIASALVATIVSAQLDITALPDCSVGWSGPKKSWTTLTVFNWIQSKCSIDSIAGTGCALTDYGCMCQNGGLFQLLVPCVMNACSSKTDQQSKTFWMPFSKQAGYWKTSSSSARAILSIFHGANSPAETYNLFQTACASYHVIPPLPSSLLTSSNTSATPTSSSSSSTTTPTVMFDLSTIPPCAVRHSSMVSAVRFGRL